MLDGLHHGSWGMTDDEIHELIAAYRARVFEVTDQLGAHFGVRGQELLAAWNRGDIPQINEVDGQRLYFHGVGLAVQTEKRGIDFDWGPNGELGGFDPSRLAGFSTRNKPFKRRTPPGYPQEEIQDALSRLQRQGRIEKRGPGLGDHLYFLLGPK